MIKVLIALFCVSVVLLPSMTWWVAQRPVPVLDGVAELDGLSKPVLIRYDSRAVAYIKAENDEDLYAAQGYAVARERMFQMDMLRRQANGRTAEVFGINFLANDRLMRTIGFARLAEAELKNLSAPAKEALDAYTRGVNSYLSENSDKLPLEFTLLGYKPEPWRAVDTLALMKYLSYELDESWKLDEFRFRVTNKVGDNLAAVLFKDDYAVSSWSPDPKVPSALPKQAAPALPDSSGRNTGLGSAIKKNLGAWGHCPEMPLQKKSPIFNPDLSRKLASLNELPSGLRRPDRSWGSSAWVLAPSFSKSGFPMLAADKHAGLSCPTEFFLCNLHSGSQHVAGAALPGVPGIVFGRNENIAWAGASMNADVQDLFVEHFASEMDNKYKTPQKIETANEFREAIPVRFGKDVDHKITITKHGPVLLRDKESAIALAWTGAQTDRPWLNSLIAVNRASDWNSFKQSLSNYGGSVQVFVYTDKRGNSGCHAAGSIPVRLGDAQGTTMSEGWLAKGEWVATVNFNDLPETFIAAGSPPKAQGDFCIAAGQKLFSAKTASGSDNPLWGHQWDPPYRANRLALSLPRGKNAGKLDLFDFNAYQGDELSMIYQLVVAELKKSFEASKSIDASQQRAIELLQGWDGNLRRDSAAASCYESFLITLSRRLLEEKLGRQMCNEYFQHWPLWVTFTENYLRSKPKDFLPSGERLHDTFMLTTFAKSNSRLRLLFDNNNVDGWTWEKAHLARFSAIGMEKISWLRYLLDIKDVGVGGDANCLNACDIDMLAAGGAFKCKNGPVVRFLIDMSDSEAFYGNLALGQSGHLLSSYRQDQLKSWLKADPLPIAFSEAQVEKQCRQKFYLSSPGYR